MNTLGTKQLETSRLILRKLTLDDASQMFNNWCCDEEVTKYLSWFPHENIEFTKNLLTSWVMDYIKNDFYLWGIVLKDNNELIGTINGFNKQDNTIEIGYCIAKKHWHKGYTSEALKEVSNFLLNEVKFDTLYAKHIKENINSGKVMLKCGYKYLCDETMKDKYNKDVLISSYVLKKDV